MEHKKYLRELTIKDNFMFGAVMAEKDNCRRLLELILGISINHVKISKEKSIVFHPEYKGVRLDVVAADENRTHYNVEMQVARQYELGRRTRYYHSQIDMEMLSGGEDYSELPNGYVIFICDFDPFGKGKYRYTFQNICMEDKAMSLEDGSISIFLNTRGVNSDEVPVELVKFLEFVRADNVESEKDFGDEFVLQLQNTIHTIKSSRRMEDRFMLFEELLRDERAEGKAEGIIAGRADAVLVLLEELGPVPEELKEKITSETNLDLLEKYLKYASEAGTIEDFTEKIR